MLTRNINNNKNNNNRIELIVIINNTTHYTLIILKIRSDRKSKKNITEVCRVLQYCYTVTGIFISLL